MIVKMKALTLLCLDADREATLARLHALGVLHLASTTPPQGENLDRIRGESEKAAAAYAWLQDCDPSSGPSDELELGKILSLREHAERLETIHRELSAELERIRPLGDFRPVRLEALRERNITVRFYEYPADQNPAWPMDASVSVLSSDDESVCVAVARLGDFERDLKEIAIPERGAAELRAELEQIEEKQRQAANKRRAYAAHRGALRALLAQLAETEDFETARLSMGEAGRVSYIAGYVPEDAVPGLEAEAHGNGWALLVRDPADDEAVPTKMKQPRMIAPIQAVYDVIKIIPGCREQAVSAIFLPFFSIFFAMLIGDAGYGVIFLGLTAFARARMPKAPLYPFALMFLLSASTVIWGTLTGNYFGMSSELAPLSAHQIHWLQDDTNVMRLCFLIGAIHMTIAHVWRFLIMLPSRKALSQLGWIGVLWAMFFYARDLVTAAPAPECTPWMLAGGSVLILLFTAVSKEELKTEGINLVMLPLNLVGALVDVISYIRLFAVGMASLAVAQSFNDMALGIGFGNVLIGLASALILVLGHLLNIILCGLAVLVHGVRLNTLEFSMHMGMEWSGTPYSPFARRKQATLDK